MADKEYKLQTCYHCGNKGLMSIEHLHSYDYGGPEFDSVGNCVGRELEEKFKWYMLSCPVCHKVTLREEYTNECFRDYDTVIETLYPKSTIDYTGVPKNIKTAFESALKVKNIDPAICSLALRRVLEAICKEKGANGKTLELMIADMIDRGILPQMFDDACWIVRQLGNSAAHGDNAKFTVHQVDQTIDFMQNILNYLYSLPVKMQKMRSAIEVEKQGNGENKNGK